MVAISEKWGKSGVSFLEGRKERWKIEARIRESVRRSEERSIVRERSRTGRAAGRAMLAERMGWSRGGFERETERQLGSAYENDNNQYHSRYASDSEIREILRRERDEIYGMNVQNIIDGSYVPSWKIELREKLFGREDDRDYDDFGHLGMIWNETSSVPPEGSYPFSVRSGSYREEDNDYGRPYESLSESEKEQVRRALNGDDIDNTSYYHDYPEDDYTEEDMLRNIEEVKSGKWRSVDVDREESFEHWKEADFERWKEDQRERWEALAEAEYQADRRRRRLEEEYDYDDGFDRDDGNRRNASGGY